MRCPFCGNENTKVVDSRAYFEGNSIKRRRECEKCGKRFNVIKFFIDRSKSNICYFIQINQIWKYFIAQDARFYFTRILCQNFSFNPIYNFFNFFSIAISLFKCTNNSIIDFLSRINLLFSALFYHL